MNLTKSIGSWWHRVKSAANPIYCPGCGKPTDGKWIFDGTRIWHLACLFERRGLTVPSGAELN